MYTRTHPAAVTFASATPTLFRPHTFGAEVGDVVVIYGGVHGDVVINPVPPTIPSPPVVASDIMQVSERVVIICRCI